MQTSAPGAAVGDGSSGFPTEGGGTEVGGLHLLSNGVPRPGHEGIGTKISRGGAGAPYSRFSCGANRDSGRPLGATATGGGAGSMPLRSFGSSSVNSDSSPLGTPRRIRSLKPSLASDRFWRLASEDSGSDSDEVGVDSGTDCSLIAPYTSPSGNSGGKSHNIDTHSRIRRVNRRIKKKMNQYVQNMLLKHVDGVVRSDEIDKLTYCQEGFTYVDSHIWGDYHKNAVDLALLKN